MNQLYITVASQKPYNNRNTNRTILTEKITIRYKFLQSKISQTTINVKENGYGDIILEINDTKVRCFCLPKVLENTKIGVTQTLSAKDEVTEVLLHIVGSDYLIKKRGVKSVRWLTKLRHKEIITILERLYDGWFELFGERICGGVLDCMRN